MMSRTVTVVNQLGMHARAAAKFVHVATRFRARVRVARDAREMDGKSIMGILLLAAARGSTLTISAEGADEADAVAALTALVESGFGGRRVRRLIGIGVSPRCDYGCAQFHLFRPPDPPAAKRTELARSSRSTPAPAIARLATAQKRPIFVANALFEQVEDMSEVLDKINETG